MLTKFIGLLTSLFLFSSCSGLVESTRESLLSDKSKRKKPQKEAKWVSRSQYDDLLNKYKELNQRYQSLKDEKSVNTKTVPMAPAETIDVFAEANRKAQQQLASKKPVTIALDQIDKEIEAYKKAKLYLASKKVDEALKLFQGLEKAKSKQIQVRSKQLIGDIYMDKAQYDLALQVYESVIRQFSFSGTVLSALRSAMKCSEMLGLSDKQEQYQSMLRDVFGVQV